MLLAMTKKRFMVPGDRIVWDLALLITLSGSACHPL